MAGGVRGGRVAKEVLGVREYGHESGPRAGLASLPGGLGAERRLPEFAEAEAAKRRFDAGHREAVDYEFHRAFEVFHERKGPGFFSGKKGFLFILDFCQVTPAQFVSAKPNEEIRWGLESLWNAVQSSGAMILFLPLAIPIMPKTVNSFPFPHSGQFLVTGIPNALNLGLMPFFLGWQGSSTPDSATPIKTSQPHRASDPSWFEIPGFAPFDALAPKEIHMGPPEKKSIWADYKPPASRMGFSDFARHMDSVQVTRARMDELAQNGFSPAEQLEFLEKLEQASTAKTGGEFASPTFFKRTRKISPLYEASWLGAEPRIPLPAYNADIFWDGNSSSWSFRPRPNRVDWIIKRSGEFLDVRHAEITLSLNESLHNKLQVKFLPEVRVYVDISIQMDPVEGRRVLVVTEQFDKEKPMYGEALPTWGRSTLP